MNKRYFFLTLLLTASILPSPNSGLLAQSPSPTVSMMAGDQATQKNQQNKNSKAEPNRRAERTPAVVPERRVEQLLAFVEQHHVESLPLLEVLREKRAKKFARVIGNLDREVAGLDRLKKQSQRAYSNALKQWINRSKINLLTAQLKTSIAQNKLTKADQDDLAKQIRKLLNENVDMRVQQLSFEIKSAAKRKQRLEKSLVELLQNRDSKIAGRIEAITKVNSRKTKESVDSATNSPRIKK